MQASTFVDVVSSSSFSNMMVTFNSSVNFVIYCIFGEKFKRVFCRMFCSSLIRRNDNCPTNDFMLR